MRNTIHIIYFLIFLSYQVNAQRIPPSNKVAPYTILTLADKVNKSEAVVEGTVISNNFDYGFHGPQGSIFSSKIIRISKIFKGDIKDTIIELIIEGGLIPDGPNKDGMTGHDGSDIGNAEGIFFLRNNNSTIQSGKKTQSYFFLYFNSLIVYDIYKWQHETRIEGKTTSDFENDIYKRIEAITGIPRKVIGLMPFEIEMQQHPPHIDGDTIITFPNAVRKWVFKKDLKN